MMSFDVYDMLGFEIKVGDDVVGSFSHGSSAATRIGEVVEKKVVKQKRYGSINTPSNYYLKIRWIHGWGRPEKPSLISVKPGEKSQLLKVDISGIK